MSVSCLPLGRAAILAPTEIHVGILGATMLWPGDRERERRAKALAAWSLDRQINDDAFFTGRTPAEHRESFKTARRVGSPEQLVDGAHIAIQHGVAVGRLLHSAILEYEKTGRAPYLKGLKNKIVAAGVFTGSGRSFDNIITLFRPVASLWAGLIALNRDSLLFPLAGPFPCQPVEIVTLLELAEELRTRAEAVPGGQRLPALLPPGASLAILPDVLALLQPVDICLGPA